MSVAPSFQNFEFLSEPYEVSGKMYIRVRNPKTGTERQVRWYDEKKTSGVQKSTEPQAHDIYYKPMTSTTSLKKKCSASRTDM